VSTPSPTNRVEPLSGMAAAGLLARLTVRRLFRSRAIWVTVALCFLPALFAYAVVDPDDRGLGSWNEVFAVALGLLAIVPPLHLASAVAEEVEDNTFTYLWSRPMPRWSVIVGKLAAIAPVLALLLSAGTLLGFDAGYGSSSPGAGDLIVRAALALTLGVLGAGCVAIGLGSLIPRQALAVSIIYLLIIDLPIGALPFSLRNLSITYHVRHIAGVEKVNNPVPESIGWLAGIAAIWLVLAFWRIARAEYSTDK
jgi:ABC-2 type transport system permease protein